MDNLMNITQALQKVALSLPKARRGVACAGTAVECPTVTVGNKAFLFLGKTEVRLKLGDSIGEATKLAAKEPSRYEVGVHGWVKLTFRDDAPPPLDVLERWIGESYRLLAPKKLVVELLEQSLPAKNSRKKAPKKSRSR
jgi:hypothetical protein